MRVFILATGCFPTTASYAILIGMRDVSRYDFMSDMAFGGGTELIEAGHDEGNVWALLDEAMLYVLSLSSYLRR